MATHNHYPKSEVKLDTPFPTPQKIVHNTTAGPGPSYDRVGGGHKVSLM